ncbi:hypothetical protein [Stenotrophobium rhamnosiphilum]|uniref:Uncharacterized protein n=1 Tax=Stenotrophobium rhamnosiphilum TaxID=2029166 RepID=A0A2T5MH11_9GAMM|nr:hypothetical protein [Stenotrophobium rhamnosiphilum]PTU31875.1 hypothetical protein CJD38_04095 [Stenotrophobium rhamnosiphilum]
MDPLSITIEIFVATVTGAIFGGMTVLVILDGITDHKALKFDVVRRPVVNATVQKIQPQTAAQQASNIETIPKAA